MLVVSGCTEYGYTYSDYIARIMECMVRDRLERESFIKGAC
jgi:hypothetical protein